jgi:DHA2 family multidrug resistance protein
VDLNEVTFTDTNGERLLRRLAKDGAQFIASGIYTKHILEQSVGTSAVTTLIARRGQYHQSVLAEYTRSPRFNASVAGLANRLTHVGLSPYSAHQQALDRMYRMVIAQAQAMSYVDVYWLLAATGG